MKESVTALQERIQVSGLERGVWQGTSLIVKEKR